MIKTLWSVNQMEMHPVFTARNQFHLVYDNQHELKNIDNPGYYVMYTFVCHLLQGGWGGSHVRVNALVHLLALLMITIMFLIYLCSIIVSFNSKMSP